MIEKAVKFAIKAHEGQFRKGSSIPYITHPLEVCTIVSLITDDEEVRCAAILHDTVEDTSVTIEDIEENFTKRVANLVEFESEDKSKSWIERKMHTLNTLKDESIEVKIIALADKLSNIRSSARDYLSLGDDFLSRFNEKDKVKQAMYYYGILDALKDLKDNDFYKEYEKLCDFVFGDVKEKV